MTNIETPPALAVDWRIRRQTVRFEADTNESAWTISDGKRAVLAEAITAEWEDKGAGWTLAFISVYGRLIRKTGGHGSYTSLRVPSSRLPAVWVRAIEAQAPQ